MISVHKPISRFAAFLLLTAAIGLPLSTAISSHASHILPCFERGTLTADGATPLPPPKPVKQT